MKYPHIKVFILICALAFILRFFDLGKVPASLNWDEASNCYNAYSILKTGRDEYGKLLPMSNRSFEDFKPPLYMYSDIIPIFIFGLNEYAVRFPSALFGTLAVISIFFLAKKLFRSIKIGYFSMLFLALTPWALHFSRVGFEASLGMSISLIAFTLLIYALAEEGKVSKAKITQLILASIFLGLSAYTYHSARLLVPLLLILTLVTDYKRIILFKKKILIISLAIIFLALIPLIVLNPRRAFYSRLIASSESSTSQNVNKTVTLSAEDKDSGAWASMVLHSPEVINTSSLLEKYMSNFDLNFLFNTGDNNLRHHIENHGLLYLFQLPLVLIGLYFLVKNGIKKHYLIWGWICIAPMSAALGTDYPHAIRSFNLIVPLTLISAVALTHILKTKNKLLMSIIFIFIYFISLFDFLHNYFIHYNLNAASAWQYGYKQAVQEANQLQNKYSATVIDQSIEQGYIFWLFYNKEDPLTYQKLGNKGRFEKYYFDNPPKNSFKGQLFVSSAQNFPSDYQLLNTILYPSGEAAIKIGVISEK